MFLPRASLLALFIVGSCGEEKKQHTDVRGWQGFSLGVMPLQYAKKNERRYLVSVPRRYLDKALLPDEILFDEQGRIVANNIKIAVRYPTLQPVPADYPGRDVARFQVGNIVEDAIRTSLDGSWLNHYSIYNAKLPDAYGLNVRMSANSPYNNDRVYYRLSPEMDVRIECFSNPMRPRAGCVMMAKRPGEPYLQTAFGNDQLPQWSERLSRLQTLFRTEGKAPLGELHRLGRSR